MMLGAEGVSLAAYDERITSDLRCFSAQALPARTCTQEQKLELVHACYKEVLLF